MPTLSNGSVLTVWEEPDNSNPSPDAVLFSITETDGDVIGPIGAKPDFPFSGIDVASVDVFDGFFTGQRFATGASCCLSNGRHANVLAGLGGSERFHRECDRRRVVGRRAFSHLVCLGAALAALKASKTTSTTT